LGAIDLGLYYELNGTTTKAYLFMGDDDCSKAYICKKCDVGFFTDDLSDCYLVKPLIKHLVHLIEMILVVAK